MHQLSILFLVNVSILFHYNLQVMASVCPPSLNIEPCSCEPNAGNFTVSLRCSWARMNDTRVSDVLDQFLTWPGVSPLQRVELDGNNFTRIPSQLQQFPLLNDINLADSYFPTLPSNAFNFTVATLDALILSNSHIETIQEGAFQGKIGQSKIYLIGLPLNRFEQGAFLSVLQKMNPYDSQDAYVSLYYNRFDCYTDRCHMAWLIRDNRHLLKNLDSAYCVSAVTTTTSATTVDTGGTTGTTTFQPRTTQPYTMTAFQDLDPKDYENCP